MKPLGTVLIAVLCALTLALAATEVVGQRDKKCIFTVAWPHIENKTSKKDPSTWGHAKIYLAIHQTTKFSSTPFFFCSNFIIFGGNIQKRRLHIKYSYWT